MRIIVLALAAYTCVSYKSLAFNNQNASFNYIHPIASYSEDVTGQHNEILSAEEFHTAISTDTLATIIDVRHTQEYEEGHINNAILLDVTDEETFCESIKNLDKSRTYYIYCRSGRRSAIAHKLMKLAGLKGKELDGGILNWEKHDFHVSKE